MDNEILTSDTNFQGEQPAVSVLRDQDSLVTALSGTPILNQLSEWYTLRADGDKNSDGVILGFDLPRSPASLVDTSVGQVIGQCFCIFTWFFYLQAEE